KKAQPSWQRRFNIQTNSSTNTLLSSQKSDAQQLCPVKGVCWWLMVIARGRKPDSSPDGQWSCFPPLPGDKGKQYGCARRLCKSGCVPARPGCILAGQHGAGSWSEQLDGLGGRVAARQLQHLGQLGPELGEQAVHGLLSPDSQ